MLIATIDEKKGIIFKQKFPDIYETLFDISGKINPYGKLAEEVLLLREEKKALQDRIELLETSIAISAKREEDRL